MNLPHFTYNPNAYALDLFETNEGECSICHEQRSLQYVGSFYSIEEPDYICPWCIANGKAAEKYDGEFNDYCGIEGVAVMPGDEESSIPKGLLDEICTRTPSYFSWQQEAWLTHCHTPCAFVGYADSEMIEPLLDELKDDIDSLGINSELIKNNLTTDGHLVGYLFQCLTCKQHRLHVDFD